MLIDYFGCQVNLLGIYAPTNPAERNSFENLHEFFIPASSRIICGDFNSYDSELDKFGGNYSPCCSLSDFKVNFNLIDVWRKQNPRSHEFTWFNSDFSIASRLDKFFISPDLVRFISSSSIRPCCFSDHDFVDIVVDLSNFSPQGPGLWKFNNSLLADAAFCDHISSRINDLTNCTARFSSFKDWWEFFKLSLKEECIDFAKHKCTELNRERVNLTNPLILCKQRLVRGDTSASAEIVSLEACLFALFNLEIEGVKTRSRPVGLKKAKSLLGISFG